MGEIAMLQPNALIVDASISMRNYVRAILYQELGFVEIHEAKDADEAFRVLESKRTVDWIFSSLEMPGRSPFDLVGGSKSRRSRFVLMSSNDGVVARETAIRKGVDDYLQKPFVPSQLVGIVRRLDSLVERRDAGRFRAALFCEINVGFDSFHHYGAELVDVSLGGCRMRTSRFKPGSGLAGDIATVTLLPESGSPFHVYARIKRAELCKGCADPLRNTEVAVEFVEVSPSLREQLTALIRLCEAKVAVSRPSKLLPA